MISQKFPWSGLKFSALKALMSGDDSPEDAALNLYKSNPAMTPAPEGMVDLYVNMMGAMSRWLRGGKYVINVSIKAQQVLGQATRHLIESGHDPLRWGNVPNPGNYWFDKPIMFHFEGAKLGNAVIDPTVSFAQSIGELFDERVRYCGWTFVAAEQDGYRLPGKHDMLWLPSGDVGTPQELTPDWWEGVRKPVHIFARFNELVDGRTEGDMVVANQVILTMLCLTALASEERIPILRKRKGRRGTSRGVRSGRINVMNYDLDESGLFVWRKTYITDQTGQAEPKVYPEERTHPVLHRVRRHQTLKWVLPENVEEGEAVVERKTRDDGTELHGVMRWRDSFVRGDGFREEQSRMRVGFDDINVKK